MAAVFDSAAALFLLARSGLSGALPRALRLLSSPDARPIVACSLLGGPVFMGGYVAAVLLAGPSYALTATATYPVFGALFSSRWLGQRLNRIAWLGVIAAAVGAALTAFDAGSSADPARTLIGVALALVAAAGLALEGVVAAHAMVSADADTVMTVRELISALLFALIVLAVPGGLSATVMIMRLRGLYLPVCIAGFIGGYSFAIWYRSIRKIGVAKAMALNITYAMWGTCFAWISLHTGTNQLAVTGCAIVTVGAIVTIMSGEQPSGGQQQ